MKEIKCPHCGKIFAVDESGYVEIVKQVRDDEFNKELEARLNHIKEENNSKLELQTTKLKKEQEVELVKKK